MKPLKSGQVIIWWRRCWLATVQKARKHTASPDKTSHDLASTAFSDPVSYPPFIFHSFIYSVGCLPLTKTASGEQGPFLSHLPPHPGMLTASTQTAWCKAYVYLLSTDKTNGKQGPLLGQPLSREKVVWKTQFYIHVKENFRLTPPKFYCLTSSVKTSKDFPGGPGVKNHLAMQGTWVWTLVRELRSYMPWSNQAPAPPSKIPMTQWKFRAPQLRPNEAR